jgi:zinc finger SWIM domain-containing protein 3
LKQDKTRGVWYVHRFVDDHNHALARPDEVPFHWSHRKIKAFVRAQIFSMGAVGMRKHNIMKTFISIYGSYRRVGFVDKDLYNMYSREKRKLIAKGDGKTVIGILQMRKEAGPDFFFDHQVDDKGRLKSMFWCDSQSRRDYQNFRDVMVFDNTYKINRYGMPFIPFVGVNCHRKTTVFACAIVSDETKETYIWLLKTFLRAIC